MESVFIEDADNLVDIEVLKIVDGRLELSGPYLTASNEILLNIDGIINQVHTSELKQLIRESTVHLATTISKKDRSIFVCIKRRILLDHCRNSHLRPDAYHT